MSSPERSAPSVEEYLAQSREAEILRFTTCGSVDDGKSTLIGRLLYETRSAFADHLAAAEASTTNQSVLDAGETIDFSLLTDGLQAEREQGITIDVAYRYFQTPKRKFIIADTPGHEQYTRNMATGASTAHLSLILVDARQGVLTQSRRHAFISSLLGIRHSVVCINKMDLVDYDQAVFEQIRKQFSEFAARLDIPDLHFVPVSALRGDNVVHRSSRTPWYEGPSLLTLLESIHIASDRNLIDLRLPVQYVLRPDQDFRGYAGQLASGVVRKGDEVMVLPSRRRSKVASVLTPQGEQDQAFPPMSVTVTLEDELDISRGDLLVHPQNQPEVQHTVDAMAVWMSEDPLSVGKTYLAKHLTQTVKVKVDAVRYEVDVDTLRRRIDRPTLGLNAIGRVALTAARPLPIDPYRQNRATGSMILIDPIDFSTVGALMLLDRKPQDTPAPAWSEVAEPGPRVEGALTEDERRALTGHGAATVWLTGLPASGAAELAYGLERRLVEDRRQATVLDGGRLRAGLSQELDFSTADTAEHLRRAAWVAQLLNRSGQIAICSFVSPRAAQRRQVAEVVGAPFLEVHVASEQAWCEDRDKAEVYARAKRGELRHVAGVDTPYEAPADPALVVRPDQDGIDACVDALVALLRERGIL